MSDWTNIQKESGHHRAAIILFPVILFLGYFHPAIAGIGLVVFFLVTSFRLLKTMIIYMLILGALSALIPPLAPIIFIIMIILFIRRIGFVIKNWKPFVAGIFIYGAAGALLAKISSDPYSWLSYRFSSAVFMEAVIVAVIGFFVLRSVLIWLYQQGYTSSTALGIMGSAPLIIISFILPFLKMHIGGDFFAHDAAFTDGHVVTSGDHVIPNGGHSSDPAIANGSNLQHVQAHVRTAPDGDPTNNLSYHGPDAKPPNMQNLVQVHDYVRTDPDGVITNNLSYNGGQNIPATPSNVHGTEAEVIFPTVLGEGGTASNPSKINKEQLNKVTEITQSNPSGQTTVDRLVDRLTQISEDKKTNQQL
ncbi:hypothetical protein ABES03_16770 [Neobacillus rhizosphaerae]|uniref:hypothetical protein n=1 Tax=Neobacillus rhizosphaerae TaxID=2880965 RepID=UPI003D27FA75